MIMIDVEQTLKRVILTRVEPDRRELGRGAYGRVFTVKYRGIVYAAKEIHSILVEGVGEEEKQAIKKSFLRECYQCSTLHHENIVQFIGICYLRKNSYVPVMMMELMDRSLTSFINDKPKVDVKAKIPILLDVSRGLTYLHTRDPPIIHRDLSPNNVMLTNKLIAKIGDLGVAKVIQADNKQTKSKLTTNPGTTDFMPPESGVDNPNYGTALDIFSFGGITLFVVSGEWPTPTALTEFDPKTRSVRGFTEVERRQQFLDKLVGVAEELKPLTEKCLDNDPKMRPNINAVSEVLGLLYGEIKIRFMQMPQIADHNNDPSPIPPRPPYFPVTSGPKSFSNSSNIDTVNLMTPLINSVPSTSSPKPDANKYRPQERQQSTNDGSPPLPPRLPIHGLSPDLPLRVDSLPCNRVRITKKLCVHRAGSLPLTSTEGQAASLTQALKSGQCHIKWTRCADLPHKIYGASVAGDNENVYVTDTNSPCHIPRNIVYCYDISMHQWKELPEPEQYYFVLLMVNGQVTAIGGLDFITLNQTSKVSTFSKLNNSWISLYPNLLIPRFKPGAVVHCDHVIVAGGQTGDGIADDIEILNFRKVPLSWKRLHICLPCPMFAMQLVVFEEELYICGYNDNISAFRNVYRILMLALLLDQQIHIGQQNSAWIEEAMVPFSRVGVASTHPPMIAGGSFNSKLSSDVFILDAESHAWKKVASLTSPRSSVAIATINNTTIMVIGGYSKGGSVEAAAESSLTTVELGEASELV